MGVREHLYRRRHEELDNSDVTLRRCRRCCGVCALPLPAPPVQPFVVEKANQEYSASGDVCVLLQALARMFAVPNPLVQLAAAEVLLAYASTGDDGECDAGGRVP